MDVDNNALIKGRSSTNLEFDMVKVLWFLRLK